MTAMVKQAEMVSHNDGSPGLWEPVVQLECCTALQSRLSMAVNTAGAGQKPYSPIALIAGVTHWTHPICTPFSAHPGQSRFETDGRYSTGDF
jgi:hypothetical protein